MSVPSPIAVTGASGFIGSWIVKLLLDQGAVVHATVRSRNDQAKVAHLEALARTAPGRLALFEANLLEPSGFLCAIAGCKVVIHVASPFRVMGVKHPAKELVEPAVTGTRNVLQAVNAVESVDRVVLTSSVAAIHTDAMDHQPTALNESLWNESASLTYQPYAYSKTLAEREAWRIAEAQSRWQLVTINPSFVLGPNLSKRIDATSIDLILQLVDGRAKYGVPDLPLGVVDVRDVATAHVLAASLPGAQGRHIVSNEVLGLHQLAKTLREIYGDRFPIPKRTVPKALLYLAGPMMGLSWRYVKRNIGVSFCIDNTKSREALGLSYMPTRQSLKDCVDQLVSMGLLGKTVAR